MYGNSAPIQSTRTGLHPRLLEVVARHRVTSFLRPPADHSRRQFDRTWPQLDAADQIILDAGCGTGESTVRLGRRFPDLLAVGVDKSARRLRLTQSRPDNVILIRAELVDWWLLSADAGVRYELTTLFYPNPWPKDRHLRRRWHGHPIFPDVLASTGRLELRTNWRIYAEEFAAACSALGQQFELDLLEEVEPVSPFERKYAASAHSLFRVRASGPSVATNACGDRQNEPSPAAGDISKDAR